MKYPIKPGRFSRSRVLITYQVADAHCSGFIDWNSDAADGHGALVGRVTSYRGVVPAMMILLGLMSFQCKTGIRRML
ncbi:hypothetical protein [Novipirellula caenicola]|uniref:Uncharacterized protein n=1 Tax=Novipirellula caenicola TaxID=1536901 RepID=A0ABP9W1X0_9BACT